MQFFILSFISDANSTLKVRIIIAALYIFNPIQTKLNYVYYLIDIEDLMTNTSLVAKDTPIPANAITIVWKLIILAFFHNSKFLKYLIIYQTYSRGLNSWYIDNMLLYIFWFSLMYVSVTISEK